MDARARVADPDPEVSLLFGALADPARRQMLQSLLHDGPATVPALTATLPISRQAVAKHLAALEQAGLVQRTSSSRRREVIYQPAPRGLAPAIEWLAAADAAWATRLERLKLAAEGGHRRSAS
jgi:DNA-binding transcriptional ArsR family regulator